MSCFDVFSARLNLAQVCLKQKKYTQVREYCDKALKLDDKNVKGYYRRGIVSQIRKMRPGPRL